MYMTTKKCKLCLLLIAFFALQKIHAQEFDTVQIRTNKITDNIYMLEGAGGNIGVLRGGDGVVLIDDQFAPLSEKIKAAVRAIDTNNIRFVINTHFHGDHVGGNENFGKAGAVIVAHNNSRLRMSVDQFNKTFNSTQKAAPYDALPKITFEDSVTLHLNGQTLQAVHVRNAHTDRDVLIFFKEANVLHAGDVFVRYGLPYIDQPSGGSIDGMISGCDVILKLADDNTKIIPGHGAVATSDDVLVYKTMLETIRKRIVDLMKSGKTLDEIIAADPTKEYKTDFDRAPFIKLVYDSSKK